MSDIGKVHLLERAQLEGWPSISSGAGMTPFGIGEGEQAWRLAAMSWTQAEKFEVNRLLNKLVEDRERERDAEEKRALRDAPPDPEVGREIREQARADMERHERERPKRMEELLARIAGAVESLAYKRG